MGQANIFINFSRIFSIHEDVSHEVVMDGRGATTESLLSDGASLLSISAAIEQHHLLESIFHLLKEILKYLINIVMVPDGHSFLRANVDVYCFKKSHHTLQFNF